MMTVYLSSEGAVIGLDADNVSTVRMRSLDDTITLHMVDHSDQEQFVTIELTEDRAIVLEAKNVEITQNAPPP